LSLQEVAATSAVGKVAPIYIFVSPAQPRNRVAAAGQHAEGTAPTLIQSREGETEVVNSSIVVRERRGDCGAAVHRPSCTCLSSFDVAPPLFARRDGLGFPGERILMSPRGGVNRRICALIKIQSTVSIETGQTGFQNRSDRFYTDRTDNM
jgi:hypothetical protein